ncbi:MAG: hypothetical protein IJC56_09310 [Clostridia bacterium]|nr:hypothetical protein [Clostridia bacterium]
MKKFMRLTKTELITIIISGIIIGTILIIGDLHFNAPVSREEAVPVSAEFTSSDERIKKGRLNKIIMRFEDHAQMDIGGMYVNKYLRDDIRNLKPGTDLTMLIHPYSKIIMEIRTDNDILLEFEHSSNILASQSGIIIWIGVLMYILSGTAAIMLIVRQKRA